MFLPDSVIIEADVDEGWLGLPACWPVSQQLVSGTVRGIHL